MMKTADFRDGDHVTRRRWLYLPPEGRIPLQGQMWAGVVVVGSIVLEDAPKMVFSENDQVIGAFASN